MIKIALLASIKTVAAICFLFILVLACVATFLAFGTHFDKLEFKAATLEDVSVRLRPKIELSIGTVTLHSQVQPQPDQRDFEAIVSAMRWAFFTMFLMDQAEIQAVHTPYGTVGIGYSDGIFTITKDKAKAELTLAWSQSASVAFEIKQLSMAEYNLSAEGSGYYAPLTNKFFMELAYKSDMISGFFNAYSIDDKIKLRIGDNQFNIGGVKGAFHGESIVDYKAQTMQFNGGATALEIAGDIEIFVKDNVAYCALKNAHTRTLEPLSKILPVPPEVKAWIYGNIIAEHYEAELFKLDVNLTSRSPIFSALYLDATGYDGDIKFNRSLPAAHGKEFNVTIIDNVIKIVANDAEYEGQKADAIVEIDNLVNGPRTLYLTINSPALFDNSLRHLVTQYSGSNIRVNQNTGENQTNMYMAMPLGDMDAYKNNVEIFGTDAHANVFGAELDFFDVNLSINNSIISLNQLNVNIPEVEKATVSGEVRASDRKFVINTDLQDVALINHFGIEAAQIVVPVYGEWNDSAATITIPDFGARIVARENFIDAKLDKLSKIKEFVPLLKLLEIDEGKLNFRYEDNRAESDFELNSTLPIIFSGNQPQNIIKGSFKIDRDNLLFTAIDNKLNIERTGNYTKATLSDLELDISAIDDVVEEYRSKLNINKDMLQSSDRQTFVFGTNGALRYKNHRLISDTFSFYRYGENFEFKMLYNNSQFTANKNLNDITVRGENLNTEWVRELSSVKMQGGSWDLTAYANLNDEDMYATIYIKDAVVDEAKVLTNVIALINTVPALVQFRSPGFTASGFKIERGIVELYFASGKLYFNAVRLVGTNTDILAQGSIDFNNDEIDIYASVQSAKAMSSFIGSIPLVGYLLLGDGKKIENILHITGSIDKPNVETKVAKEIGFYPLNVIGRTLTIPIKMLE